MTWFPDNVVQRWVDDRNNVIATLDYSGNLSIVGSATITGSVTVTGSVSATGAVDSADTTTQAVTAAGAINLTAPYTSIAGGTGYAVTLAAPSREGMVKVIEMISITSGEVTMALTEVVGGSAGTSASFNAAGETLVLVSRAAKWVVLKEVGVTLS
jgi:hypothetical protein